MPLRWRLALVFAVATAVVLAGYGLVLLQQVHRTLDDSIHDQLQTREAVLARFVLTRGDQLRERPLPSDVLDWPYPPGSGQTAQVFTPDDELVLSMQVPDREPLLDTEQLERARSGVLEWRSDPGSPGDGDLLRATPVPDTDDPGWVVVVGADLAGADAVLDRIRSGLVLVGPLAIALSAAGAWLLAGASLRPVERLRTQAAALSADDTGASLQVPDTGDEIAALATTMNDLLHRLQQAVARERRFLADAGHELRTPLTVLRAELELAGRSGRSREELADAVAFAAQEADRLIRLSERLLLLAGLEESGAAVQLRETHLGVVLADAVRGATARAGNGVRVRLDAAQDVVLDADPDRLRQAVDNLLDNALRFAPPRTEVTVALRREERPTGPVAVVEVADRGPGFPPAFVGRAFERFERADPARAPGTGGTGLGLAITRGLVRAHGGEAVAGNREGGGAFVRLVLPLTRAAAVSAP